MRPILISPAVLEKMAQKHNVTRREIEQCFENRCGDFLEDTREDHRSDPPTLWFLAPTNNQRVLKVIFIFVDGNIQIKSAYDPIEIEISLYDKLGK